MARYLPAKLPLSVFGIPNFDTKVEFHDKIVFREQDKKK